jgi:hypothetical protein
MPRKATITRRGKRSGKPKANLGQMEAELEKTSREQISHMEGGKPRKPLHRGTTKRGTQ